MKKFITFSLICCMAVSLVLLSHEQARADSIDDQATLITVAVVGGLALLVGLLVWSNNSEKDYEGAQLDQKGAAFQAAFNPRVGNWSFDDALALWGTPTSVTEGGNIFVAVYDQTSRSSVGNTVYHEGYLFTPATSDNSSYEVKNGELYTLMFDKNSKILVGWNWKIYVNNVAARELANGQAAGSGQIIKKGGVQAAVNNAGSGAATVEQQRQDLEAKYKSGGISHHEYMKALGKLLKSGDTQAPASAGSAVTSAPASTSTLKEKLSELKKLLDSGDITNDEYNKTRAKLIDSF